MKNTPSPTGSAERSTESPVHRTLRSLLLKHRRARKTWNQLVLVEGSKLGSAIVAVRSEMESVAPLKLARICTQRAHCRMM
jgi:hypothetical protein